MECEVVGRNSFLYNMVWYIAKNMALAMALHQSHFYDEPILSSSARWLQLTTERQHLTVRKKVRWCRAIPFQHFPKETVDHDARDFQKCSDFDSDYTSVREIPKSEVNLPSDGKGVSSRNLENELGKCHGH